MSVLTKQLNLCRDYQVENLVDCAFFSHCFGSNQTIKLCITVTNTTLALLETAEHAFIHRKTKYLALRSLLRKNKINIKHVDTVCSYKAWM